MARISTYNQDTTLNAADKFLGTDSETNGTKNFTIQSVVDLINEGSLIAQPISIPYDFGVYDEDVASPKGILTLGTGNPAAGNFSDITEILLSKTDKNGNDVEAFIDSLTNYNIRISTRDEIKTAFGVFKITAIADVDDNNDKYIKLTLTHVNSSGAISGTGKYFITINPAQQNQADWNATSGLSKILNKPTNFLYTTSSVTDLSDVASAGSGNIITVAERTLFNTVSSKANSNTTITVQGTTNEVTVSPNTAQDLSANRTVTIGLPDDVTIGDDLTVTNKVNLGGPMEFTGIESTTPTFDNGLYFSTDENHDTLHFRYHGHDLSIDYLTETIPTGILNGGELTKANSTDFTIAAGDGIINVLNKSNSDPHPEIKKVAWSQQTIEVFNLDSNETDQLNAWIYVDNTGTVQQKASAFTEAEARNNILIGAAIHSEGTLRFVRTFPRTAYNVNSQVQEFISMFGPMKKSGHVLSANGSNLSLDRSSGVSFALGRNYATDPENPSTVSDGAKTQCVIHRYYRDGSGGYVKDDGVGGAGYTTIDPSKYDDGTGTLATHSSFQFTIQRFFYFPGTPDIIIQYYGRDTYGLMESAERNLPTDPHGEADNTAQQAIYLGAIIVQQNCTDLSNTADAKFFASGAFRGITSAPVGAVAAAALSDLSDVNVSSPTNGQVIKYNSTSQQFENQDASSFDPITLDDTNDRVGINSTSPAVALEVKNTETASTSKILSIQDNSSNERLIVRNDGKVGIKTATPTHDLHVTGTANITSNTTIGGTLSITGAVTASSTIAATGNVTGANLNISNWDTAYGWGDHSSAGYLTAHPTISGAASSSDNSGQVFIQDLTLDSNGHVTGITTATASGGSIDGTGAANKIAIWSDSDTLTNDTNFHWDSTNDRLGIGTSSPTKDFTLSKSGGVTMLLSAGSAGSTNIELTPNSTGSGKGKIYTTNTLDLTLGVNSSDKVTIKNDGKVGIGTSSPAASLDITATDAIIIPKGTDAQRNALTAESGMFRFNTTDNEFEGYNGTSWVGIGTTIDTANLADSAVETAKINNDAVTGDKIADDAIDSEHYVDGSIDADHIADSAVETAKINDDAVTGAKIADDAIDSEHIADGSIDTAHIANDQITHAKLEGRYTAVQTITTTSGTINLDASSYTAFRLTSDLTGATTLNIQNMLEGQVIDITVSGSQTITFSSDDTTETFNKVGGVDYDGAEDNHIQVICLEDSDSGAIYNYAIGTYTSDTTP